jgi:serine protease
MSHHPRQIFRKLSFTSSSSRIAVLILRIIVLFALFLTSVTNRTAATASSSIPNSRQSSSTIIQVKLREDSQEQAIDGWLPPDLKNSVVNVSPLFSLPDRELTKLTTTGVDRSAQKLANLNLWFVITVEPATDSTSFMEHMRSLSSVEIVEPAPLPHPLPAITPALSESQGYLYDAPDGINATYSWSIPGGNGTGIKIYDLEYSWNQTHEDLSKARGVPLLLSPGDLAIDPFNEYNHGTAVLGELIADNDTKGVTGISWGADVGLVPVNTANMGYNPANAILLAVADGSPGDVILIEQQMTVCGLEFGGFGPSEWISSVFDAIKVATANGFVVVEAAGNGGIDLDQSGCDNLFNRSVRDSGAIIVGGGNQPEIGNDRERSTVSSYGSRVDLQGWAGGVTSTGYGTIYWNEDDPYNPDFWYTDYFNGTSSAAPMVAGAVANLQGIALKTFGRPLTPNQIRTLLVRTGSPQLGNTDEHIGPRPDLFQAIADLNDQPVVIDIKPDSSTNHVNPRSRGRIRVAVLSTPDFNTLTVVDTNSLTFGRTGAEDSLVRCKQRGRDVNHDGLRDLICEFSILAAGFQKGDSVGFLEGMTVDGVPISGQDFVIVGNASDEH